MAVFPTDSYVWLPDDVDAYLPAKVLGTFKAGEKGTVQNLATNSAYTIPTDKSKRLIAMDPQSLEPLADMVDFKQLDEPALLHNLRLRYYQDEIYTAIGSILVSVNPFKQLNIYSPAIVDNFIKNGAKANPPHVFGVADNAYRALVDTRRSQSCIVSGESGAGKTEATKMFLQYLAEKASAGDAQARTGAGVLHEKILEANPLMEAFGNAKTVRNNNSSRFGKLIKVEFDNKLGRIIGGNITSYLLEKSRLVNQSSGERNYHIFYQLCEYASMDPDLNAKLKLTAASQYFYSNPTDDPKSTQVKGMNDSSEFEGTLNAMEVLEIPLEEQDQIFQALAGILNLGNVEFLAKGDASEVNPAAEPFLKQAGEHLGMDPGALGDALIKSKVMDSFRMHDVPMAISSRDALAKGIYGLIFDWLIAKINISLSSKTGSKEADVSSISVLDIFGFESFQVNSFEQLCINYCNEKLQSHFNKHIFSFEQALYVEEGIDLESIDFADNSNTLNMIEGKQGILGMLDEVNKMRNGSDAEFLKKVTKLADGEIVKMPDTKEIRKDNKLKLVFTVVHYAGPVSYTVTSFLEKNRDKLVDDLAALGKSSSAPFIKSIFTAGGSAASGKKTLGAQFKTQLKGLMETLSATDPHYIRTIKPNNEKVPESYTAGMVLDQMRYAGLMEVCRIRKLGYPLRKDFEEFMRRYKPLATKDAIASIKTHQDLCDNFVQQKLFTVGQFQIGKKKVFMRDDQYNNLELRREVVLGEVAIKIQALIRGFIARSRYKKYKGILQALQDAAKSRDLSKIEAALDNTGILPYVGKHIAEVKEAKKVMAAVREENRVIAMVKSAIESRDLSSLNSAIAAAEDLKLNSHATVVEAIKVRTQALAEKSTVEALVEAVKANELPKLVAAIKAAEAMGLQEVNQFKDALSAMKHLQVFSETVAALDAAIAKKDGPSIVTLLTKMVDLGESEHPSVKKGQEITKAIAKASAEAEKKLKVLKTKLRQAVDARDLGKLKKLRPEMLEVGLTGALVDEALQVMSELQSKSETFNELSAMMQALEVKSKSYAGVTKEEVDSFDALVAKALSQGFDPQDEEITGMKDTALKLRNQVEAQEFLASALAKKEEKLLRKALEMVQDLGLETGVAKEVEQEVQMLDETKVEQQAAERVKEKEELKKNLIEADEDARDEEKIELLKEKTSAHQELIAKASDSTKYDFSKFYKLRDAADFLEHLPEEAKAEFSDRRLKYHPKVLPKSLLKYPTELSDIALQINKAILTYCGDLANPFPNTFARFMIVSCLENPLLVDETYLQLMKHVTENKKLMSEDRGWGLLCMLSNSAPPSPEFAPFLVNFLIGRKNVDGLIGNYARLSIVQLDGRIRLGPTKLLPDNEIIEAYTERPPVLATIHLADETREPLVLPVMPNEDVDRLLKDTVFSLLDVEEEKEHLYGLFVIDSRTESKLTLTERLNRFYRKHNPQKLAHVEYFVKSWSGNEEALFHRLEEKYGPEPTEEEVSNLNNAKKPNAKAKEKKTFLQMPITAALGAVKRIGLSAAAAQAGPRKPPQTPQTSWPVPWWAHLGDIYLRMVKQNRQPVFTFKRKLFVHGEKQSQELVQQCKWDVSRGDLPIVSEDDVADLAAIHLTVRNVRKKGPEINTDKQLFDLGLVDVLPTPWLVTKQPKEWLPKVKAALGKLKGASEKVLDEKYFEICRSQSTYGMWFFYLNQPNVPEPLIAGVDVRGIHLMNVSRTEVFETYSFRKIKEFGASPTHFWIKVVEAAKAKKKKAAVMVEDTVYLNTIQAWDMYGIVHEYTFNADKLNLP